MSAKRTAVYFFMPSGLSRAQQIGRLVTASRSLAQLTKSQLADELHVNRMVISRIEKGTCVPDVQLTAEIARATGQDFRIFEV